MKDLGVVHYFLGIESEGLFLSQERYAHQLLEKVDLTHCKPLSNPMVTSWTLDESSPVFPEPSFYRSIAGSLQYLRFSFGQTFAML